MLKKIVSLMLISVFLMSGQSFGASQWSKTNPAGTTNASDIDYWVATINNEAIDRLLTNYRENCAIYYISVASVGIKAGEVVCSNSGGTVRRFRKNTSVTALTWANIDTGSEATGTTYYVYAVADTDATTFTGVISTSSTAPVGCTYYKLLGSFYNDASGNILNDDTLINYNNYYALRFGDWVSKSNNTVYQASTDGFAVGYTTSEATLIGYTDNTTPPTTIRAYQSTGSSYGAITLPVKRGDYWKMVSSAGIVLYWIPLSTEV